MPRSGCSVLPGVNLKKKKKKKKWWKIISWEKLSSKYLKDFTDFFYTDIFFIIFDKYLITLSVTQSVCCTLNNQPFCWFGDTLAQRFWPYRQNFKNLSAISDIFQETLDFLVLTDSLIISIYLIKSQRKFLWKKLPTDILVTWGMSVILSQRY